MNSKPNQILITQAARWYARLHAPDCSAAERHAFQQWLEADPDHARVFQQAVNTTEYVKRQALHDDRLKALAAKAFDDSAKPRSDGFKDAICSHWRSAAVLLMGVGMIALTASKIAQHPTDVAPAASYVNNESHERQIKLSDGSVLHLDVGAEVTVAMSPQERHLELAKGRAYFEVAHDKTRPFSVTAAGTRTVALGTRFEVSLLPQTVNVTLAEGSVAITNSVDTNKWREILTPGQQLQVNVDDEHRQRVQVDAETIVGWSKGRLIFDDMPLDKVLDEVNRYASIKVHLGDAQLASIPIGGNFVAGADTNEFVETLTAVLPIRSVRTGANEIVLFQRYETHNP